MPRGICLAIILVCIPSQAKPLPSEADVKKAQEILKDTPNDPDSNTTVGKYVAFVQGDFEEGMKYLTNSGDKTLSTLAQHERAPLYVDTPVKQVGMGDEWVVAAKNFAPIYKVFHDRASQWYAKAYPFLDGPWQQKAHAQLRKVLQNPAVPDVKGATAPASWKVADKTANEGATAKASHSGKMSYQVLPMKHSGMHYYPFEGSFVPVQGGKTYEFSFWALADGTDQANDQISVQVFGPGGKNLSTQFVTIGMDQPWWQKFEAKFDVAGGGVAVTLRSNIASTVGTLYFDDFSLKVDGKEVIKNGSFEDAR